MQNIRRTSLRGVRPTTELQQSAPYAVREFDAAEFLEDDQAIAEHLNAVLEENDPALLAAALGDVARAKGMTAIARDSGIGREALYKALRPGAQPRFDTVQRVCSALGIKLTVMRANH